MTLARPVLKYFGGKFVLAPWVVDHFPRHRVYVEPFGGAASVLLHKPRCHSEIYNDLDDGVVNLFRVLRDPDQAERLRQHVALTPYARREFDEAYLDASDSLSRAVSLIIRTFMGHGSAGPHRRTGFRVFTESGTHPARDWTSWPEQVAAFCERLRGVVIENRPALHVIDQHDAADALFYVDPPYPLGTRHGKVYRHEMSDDDHRELARALHAVRGYVVLSGYACELYDRELFPTWRRVERDTNADGGRDRTEVLWLSPRTAHALAGRQESLFT